MRVCFNVLGPKAASLLLLQVLLPPVKAYDLDPDSKDSIKSVSRQMTDDMMSFYSGHQPGGTPGLLPNPYYWWEAGAMLGALIDYWYYTKDEYYNDITTKALLFQVGPDQDYMPPNQTLTEGNDDQGFWGLAVMAAAEYNFPNPPADKPQWLALAQAVFNTQVSRWDTKNCNGGLRWQIFEWNNGFDYKNSVSQACFFALAARLALYTKNETYSGWAETTWDWMIGTGLMDKNYYIYDGGHIEDNCTHIVPYQWTYNAGAFLHGAAALYNLTENDKWKEGVNQLLNATGVFFPDGKNIMEEIACEPASRCNLDEQSFKAYLARWLAVTTQWAPWTYDKIRPWLRDSAVAAAKRCTGGDNGRMCGLKWNTDGNAWDGSTGVGQQMAAMEITVANLVKDVKAPLSEDTGGTSVGDPSAGSGNAGRTGMTGSGGAIDAVDKAGAWFITLLAISSMLAEIAFMFIDDWGKEAWTKRRDEWQSAFSVGQTSSLLRAVSPTAWSEKISSPSLSGNSGDGPRATPLNVAKIITSKAATAGAAALAGARTAARSRLRTAKTPRLRSPASTIQTTATSLMPTPGSVPPIPSTNHSNSLNSKATVTDAVLQPSTTIKKPGSGPTVSASGGTRTSTSISRPRCSSLPLARAAQSCTTTTIAPDSSDPVVPKPAYLANAVPVAHEDVHEGSRREQGSPNQLPTPRQVPGEASSLHRLRQSLRHKEGRLET